MPKSVTVRFEDGTSHVYDDVPDEITDAQVQERAASEFNKKIEAVNPPPAGQRTSEPNFAEKAVGAAQVPFQLAAEIGGPAALAFAAGRYGGKAFDMMKNLVGGQGAVPGPVAPPPAPAPMNPPTVSPSYTAPGAAAAQEAQQIQKANSIVRSLALQKLVGAAAVPAAVGAGGAAATGLAGRQMQAMTPEQRKKFYDSSMMGAMSGDAGLAAAIMNQGQ